MSSILHGSLLGVAFASPVPAEGSSTELEKRFSETNPWQLTNIVAHQAANKAAGQSHFGFHFEDTNKGIKLQTDCKYTLPAGSTATLADGQYHPCDNNSVSFSWDGTTLSLERSYTDPS